MILPKIPKAVWLIGAVLLTIVSLYGFYLLGAKSCAGVVAVDTVEELQDDQETANELSNDASQKIRQLEQTIAGLRREKSEIDTCMLPDDTKRLRKDALSVAFPSSD